MLTTLLSDALTTSPRSSQGTDVKNWPNAPEENSSKGNRGSVWFMVQGGVQRKELRKTDKRKHTAFNSRREQLRPKAVFMWLGGIPLASKMLP